MTDPAASAVRSRTSGPGPRLTLAVVSVTLLCCLLAWVQKLPCRGGWSEAEAYTDRCYSDIVALWYARGLVDGSVPYYEAPLEYPVLLGAVVAALAWVTNNLGDGAVEMFFDLNAAVLSSAAVVTALATLHTTRGDRRALVALGIATPAFVLTAFINWDLLAVALVALALLAWLRDRPVAAGTALGLAVGVKFYPVVLLGPVLLVCLRSHRVGDFFRLAVAAAATWLVVNVPVALTTPTLRPNGSGEPVNGWAQFYVFSSERGLDWGSIWLATERLWGWPTGESANLLGAGAFAVLCALIAVLALRAQHRPALGPLAFLTVAAFALTNKVYSPQFVLWLIPLAALALPRWRFVLTWQVGEVAYVVGIWAHLAFITGAADGLAEPGYLTVLGLRWVALSVLAAAVAARVWRPTVPEGRGPPVPTGPLRDPEPSAG